ncbi:MAG: DUF1573 domain-containing protein [Bacteroidales bacterium]|nr:DUF1573 domain-containing protein [Bacteroidales bacterium]
MIKRIYLVPGGLFLVLILGLLSCGGQNGSQNQTFNSEEETGQIATGQALMLFDTLIHDFGTIIEGEKVVCYFDFRNGGEEDLLITSVEATCGCTTPDWKREPLGPGSRASLSVIFDASGRSGIQRKLITVRSNASNGEVRLTIRAVVKTIV